MYEIIDTHAHIYPTKIAEKATTNIGKFYDIEMNIAAGTVDRLIVELKQAGISRAAVSSVATTRHQVSSINGYILEVAEAYPNLLGYMTLHPDMDENEIKNEIDYCIAKGIKAIKLHPDFQKFYIDSDEARKIYRQASGRLPILFHTGDNRYDYSQPDRLARIAKEFPELTAIGAHFGGYGVWYGIDCYKGIKNIYFDTSSSLMFLPPEKAKEFINYYGAEWFFFGTDFPMWTPAEEVQRFLALDLTEEQRKMILSENYKRLFNI
ncbi:MAG: amidohydrolase family protein [Clostridia bacterium]